MSQSQSSYWKTVEGIAQDAINEYPKLDDYRQQEFASESIDGSEYIVYYDGNETVLRNTNNDPDSTEVKAMSADDADWQTIRQLTAYLAMEMDVFQEIERLWWDPFADGTRERYELGGKILEYTSNAWIERSRIGKLKV